MTPNTPDALTTNHTADALLPRANITIDHPIIQFLLGESEYCGIWFGDDHPGYGAFWWRTQLRQAFSEQSNTNHVMTVWMIEWPASDNMPARWWNPRDGWMLDPNKGMRFSRKEDAEMLIQSEARRGFVSGVLPTEHKWIDRTHPTAATPAGEGWQCVPINVTAKMLRAADDAGFTSYTGTWTISPENCWKAMLAAAPKPESP